MLRILIIPVLEKNEGVLENKLNSFNSLKTYMDAILK